MMRLALARLFESASARKAAMVSAVCLFSSVVPNVALASSEGEGGGGSLLSADPGAAIWNLAIFITVFVLLSLFVWPKILEGLVAREDRIRNDLEGAEKANSEAKSLLADYNKRIAEAQAETQSLLAQARKDAEVAGQRIIDQAREEADRQRQRAVQDIDSAKKAALAEMANQTTAVAVQIARQMLGRELKAEDHAEVVRQALQGLPSKN